jgi:probable addiction module antidote protein
MKRKASVSHDEAIVRRLRKNPEFAAEYLKATLEEADDPRALLMALRHLAQAQGIAKVAKVAGIERESLYRALSMRGNPRLSTLVAVTKAIGLRLTVEAAPDIIGLGKFRSGVSDLGSSTKHVQGFGRDGHSGRT